jgi:uncharacterized protein (DUF885 family)
MMTKSIYPILIFTILLVACAGKYEARQTSQVPSYLNQISLIAEDYFKLRPEVATMYGMSDQSLGAALSGKLSHYDPATEISRRASLKSIVERLSVIDTTDFSDREKLSLNLIITEMQGAIRPGDIVDYGSVVGEYGNWFLTYPVSHLSGPHIEVMTILEEKAAVNNKADAEGYIARLNDYPNMIKSVIEKIAYDRELGVIPPDFVLDNVIAMLTSQVAGNPVDHSLLTSFSAKIHASDMADTQTYIDRVANAVTSGYFTGTRTLLSAITELRKHAVHEIAVTRLPQGVAFYDAMITHMTDTTLPAKTIHDLGLSEVKRIHILMDNLLQTVGMVDGTVGKRMQMLLNDPQYIYQDNEADKVRLIADMRGYLDSINVNIADWFGRLPDQDVTIKAIPKHRELSGCGACYDAPSKEAGTLGTFWINLANIAANPSYSLQTLTYHETNPGHHLQTIIGLSDEVPLLSTVFYSNAAGEGWGLYSESLAGEMGMYRDSPVNDLGRLQAELHRAVRLVLDTGMHSMGWSRERAIEYSIETEGIHIAEATSEVERYAIWPGQALGYKLGQLKILELRELARSELGENFDIGIFHDRILEDGALPLNMMEDKITNWIKLQK